MSVIQLQLRCRSCGDALAEPVQLRSQLRSQCSCGASSVSRSFGDAVAEPVLNFQSSGRALLNLVVGRFRVD